MLGRSIADPSGVEGEPGASAGLGLLDCETVLENEKFLCNASGILDDADGVKSRGYEIHMGRTTRSQGIKPFMRVVSRNGESVCDNDGAVSTDGNVIGTYFHGIFDEPQVRHRFLSLADPGYRPSRHEHGIEESYDRLANHVAGYLDLEKLYAMIDKPYLKR